MELQVLCVIAEVDREVSDMKCPQCGNEMTLDSHRKIHLQMCYNYGYIEGRSVVPLTKQTTNYEHLKTLNFNEMVAFLSGKLSIEPERIAKWLDDPAEVK